MHYLQTFFHRLSYAQLIRTTDIKNNFQGSHFIYIDEDAYNYLWRVHLDKETIILPNIGNCGEVYYITPEMLPYQKNALATNALVVRSSFYNNKYLSYLFKTSFFQKQLRKITSSVGQTKFNKTDLKDILIPIPPLAVQAEIVKILDNFTELTAELTARKKQYEYYRDKLLSFDNILKRGGVTKKLGEVSKIIRGASPRPINKYITDKADGMPWIKIGDVKTENKYITETKEKITLNGVQKSKIVNVGDFILSNSMSFGRPYISKIKGCIHDGWLSISKFEKYLLSDFLYYSLTTSWIQQSFKQNASSGTVQNLNIDIVKDVNIPIPSLEVQAEIVGILDKFESMCNSLVEGLPAEIEARKKQYEYYRDKLLSFTN